MTKVQLEASKTDRIYVLGVLGFNEAAAELLDENHVSDITHLINIRRPKYDALASAHRRVLTKTSVEQLETFRAWMRA